MSEDEILKGMPEGLRQLFQQVRKEPTNHPELQMTDEEAERLAAQLREDIAAAKSKADAIKAKGGREAKMEAAMAFIEEMTGAFEKAGLVPDPEDPQADLDRRPTLERNGREVVVDILDPTILRAGPVEVLVDRYVDTAVAAHHAIEHGRVTRHNHFFGRLKGIENALKARTPDGRIALLPFLSDPNPGVRSFVAHACREIAPDQAEAALAKLNAGTIDRNAEFDREFPFKP